MIKKEIEFKTFHTPPQTRKETWYFNIDATEMLDLEIGADGAVGLSVVLKKLQESESGEEAYRLFNRILKLAVGQVSDDGVQFQKSKDISDRFWQSNASGELLLWLIRNPQKAAEFVVGMFPPESTWEGITTPTLEGEGASQDS